MTNKPATAIDVLSFWARMNDQLIQLIDYIPDEKMNWSPRPELWNFRGILIHFSMPRHNWLGSQVRDGDAFPDLLSGDTSKEGIKKQLAASWQRLERFLSDPAKMSGSYQGVYYDKPTTFSGDWLAYHLLEHEIYHRADIFHYLALLGVEHPNVETP